MTQPWVSIVVLAVASTAMVVGMVRFTVALVAVKPSAAERRIWGAVYSASWAAIVLAIGSLETDGATLSPIALVAASGWIAFNALWLWLWIAMARAQEQQGAPASLPPDADVLAHRARTVAACGGAILVAALWIVGVPQRLVGTATEPGHRVAALATAIGAAGFVAFMTGVMRLALGVGRPMTREEIEEIQPAGSRRTKVRIYGQAKGVSGEQTFTFAEIANAWRSGEWRRDPKWMSVVLMLGGAALVVTAGFGAAIVLGDTTTRIVLAAMVAYSVMLAIRGRRGR